MKPITPDNKFSLLAYVTGTVFPQEPPPAKSLADIYIEGGLHRAAVVLDKAEGYYLTFDLRHVRPVMSSPYFTAHRWWMSLSKARAIAHAKWFARD